MKWLPIEKLLQKSAIKIIHAMIQIREPNSWLNINRLEFLVATAPLILAPVEGLGGPLGLQ